MSVNCSDVPQKITYFNLSLFDNNNRTRNSNLYKSFLLAPMFVIV